MSLDVSLHCPCCGGQMFEWNTTHNLGRMARKAGLYQAMWRPDELGVETAGQLVQLLQDGLARLLLTPEKYKALNPENGWGNYEGLVKFAEEYLQACKAWPKAEVRWCR